MKVFFLLLVCFFFVFFPGFFSLEDGGVTYTMYFFFQTVEMSSFGQTCEKIFLSKIPSASLVIPARFDPINKGEKGGGAKRYNFNRNSF